VQRRVLRGKGRLCIELDRGIKGGGKPLETRSQPFVCRHVDVGILIEMGGGIGFKVTGL